MRKINQVVIECRTVQGLSLRRFADALNAKLVNVEISHMTVARWENESSYSEPDVRFLFECLATYQDWRWVFAVDCISAMFPNLVESGTIVFDNKEGKNHD